MNFNKKNFLSAFSLLEQSISILILALILSITLTIIESSNEKDYYNITIDGFGEISDAIIANLLSMSGKYHNMHHNPILCPADPTLLINSRNFGLSLSSDGKSGGECLGNYIFDSDNNKFFYGMIPVRNLGLDDKYAFDAWGRRIIFVINKDIFSALNQEINVADYKKNFYTLISSGKNGYGSFDISGHKIDSTKANEAEKANIIASLNLDNINLHNYYSGYDDIVFSKTLFQFFIDIGGGNILDINECNKIKDLYKNQKISKDFAQKINFLCVFR